MFGTWLMWESMMANAPRIPTPPGSSWTSMTRPDPERRRRDLRPKKARSSSAPPRPSSRDGPVGYIGANRSPLIEGFRAGFEQGAGPPTLVSRSSPSSSTRRLRRPVTSTPPMPERSLSGCTRRQRGHHLHGRGRLRPRHDRGRHRAERGRRSTPVGDRGRHRLPVRAPRAAARPPVDLHGQAVRSRGRTGGRGHEAGTLAVPPPFAWVWRTVRSATRPQAIACGPRPLRHFERLEERIATGEIVVDTTPVGPPSGPSTATTYTCVRLVAPSATSRTEAVSGAGATAVATCLPGFQGVLETACCIP